MTQRMTRRQASEYLTARLGVKVSEGALGTLATRGRGPRFALVLGKAAYSREALDEWADAMLAVESPSSGPRRHPAQPVEPLAA